MIKEKRKFSNKTNKHLEGKEGIVMGDMVETRARIQMGGFSDQRVNSLYNEVLHKCCSVIYITTQHETQFIGYLFVIGYCVNVVKRLHSGAERRDVSNSQCFAGIKFNYKLKIT